MFTGIVEKLGVIKSIALQAEGVTLFIECDFPVLRIGQSVCVDGVCLTVTETHLRGFSCEVSPETLRVTRLRDYVVGSPVNLELALCVGDRLDGHWVLGHVDGCLRLSEKTQVEAFDALTFQGVAATDLPYLMPKGSVTLNGVSLTINHISADGLTVMLIPETLRRTNLAGLQIGDRVNVEYDYLAKVVQRQLTLTDQHA